MTVHLVVELVYRLPTSQLAQKKVEIDKSVRKNTTDFEATTGGTCPLCLHYVNLEVFTPWDVKFLCCQGYACAACDVCVTLEASEIKRHIQLCQETKVVRTRKTFGKEKTWCLCCSQTVKGSTFHASIWTNLALWTRQTYYDVIWLLLFLTPCMAGHEIVMWLKLFEKADKSLPQIAFPTVQNARFSHDETRFGNAIMLYNFSMWRHLVQDSAVKVEFSFSNVTHQRIGLSKAPTWKS